MIDSAWKLRMVYSSSLVGSVGGVILVMMKRPKRAAERAMMTFPFHLWKLPFFKMVRLVNGLNPGIIMSVEDMLAEE